jgi:membrane protein DedA with SNARE-associated domain
VISLEQIEEIFLNFSRSVPLEWYTFVGSIIEEIIGVIPSPLVLTLAGSLALSSGKGLAYLFLLGLVGSLGKTLAGWFLYFAADKGEDIVIGKFGKWVGVSHQTVEHIGKKFGKGRRDDLVIFLSRAIPIFPSAAASVVCGAIRVELKTYLIMSFLGNYVRNMIYIYLGYSGLEQAENILSGIDDIGSIVKSMILVGVVAFIGWIYYRRMKTASK